MGLRAIDTITGQHLDDRATLKKTARKSNEAFAIAGEHTICKMSRRHPRRAHRGYRRRGHGQELADSRVVPRRDGVVASIRRRSGVRDGATRDVYRIADPIRKAFAKANGVKPALFSANSEGACPACNGAVSSTPTWG